MKSKNYFFEEEALNKIHQFSSKIGTKQISIKGGETFEDNLNYVKSNENKDNNCNLKNKLIIENNFQNIFNTKNKSNISTNIRKKRNYGIDLARIFSMFFLINHHIIYHCGPMFGTKILSFENNLLLYLNSIFCSGVNIFGMISGYVGFYSYNYSKLIYLLLQTSFYNFGIAFYYKKAKPNIVKDLKYFLFPVFISSYWYFNAYFILYFFFPLINSGIKALTKREMGIFNLTIFSLFSCFYQIRHYSQLLNKDFLNLINGFSYIWLLILYFYGSYFGRFRKDNHNFTKIFFIILCSGIISITAFLRNMIIIYRLRHNKNVILMRVEYTSPSSVIISICFICIFSNLDIKSKFIQKLISFLAPLTYGVYLIHNHSIIFHYVIKPYYFWLLKYSSFKLVIIIILESSKIFIICSFIDYLRLVLFKLLRIMEICRAISVFLNKICNKILFIKS